MLVVLFDQSHQLELELQKKETSTFWFNVCLTISDNRGSSFYFNWRAGAPYKDLGWFGYFCYNTFGTVCCGLGEVSCDMEDGKRPRVLRWNRSEDRIQEWCNKESNWLVIQPFCRHKHNFMWLRHRMSVLITL